MRPVFVFPTIVWLRKLLCEQFQHLAGSSRHTRNTSLRTDLAEVSSSSTTAKTLHTPEETCIQWCCRMCLSWVSNAWSYFLLNSCVDNKACCLVASANNKTQQTNHAHLPPSLIFTQVMLSDCFGEMMLVAIWAGDFNSVVLVPPGVTDNIDGTSEDGPRLNCPVDAFNLWKRAAA